jgi:hypothetical protein
MVITLFSCPNIEQDQWNTWVSFRSADSPLVGQFSVGTYNGEQKVWRMEFQIKREALKETLINSTLSDCPPSHLMLSCDKMQPVVLK